MNATPNDGPRPFKDVRMRGFQDRAEVDVVVGLIESRLGVLAAEDVPLHEAAGRILAKDIVAPVPVPGFDRAAMDGYAVRGEETFGASPYNPLHFQVVGVALPGKPYEGTLRPGQAVRIMTGAPVPEGADAVLMAEAAEESTGILSITDSIPPGRHIGKRGEDIAQGAALLARGRCLRPQDVAVLASVGVAPVPVVRRPRVVLVITGDELLPPGSQPEGYRIVDSNSVMLEALVRRDGGDPIRMPLVRDTREAVTEALTQPEADLILVSGGSSVGQEDHAPRVLAECGELCIHGVALRPASPTGMGFLAHRPVFLLPGNPVSCLCAYDLFAGRAVRRLGGRSGAWPYRALVCPLARKIASAVGRVDYVRVRLIAGQAEPLATSGASILSSTTRAEGFVLVKADSEGHPAGDLVTVYLYDL